MRLKKRNQTNSVFNFRKGNAVLDSAFTIVVLFIFVFMCMFGYKIFLEIKDDVMEDIPHNKSREAFNEIETRYPSVVDGLVILLFFGLWIMVVTASFMNNSHPIFFAISLFLVIFVIIAGMFLGNFYEEMFNDPYLSDLPGYFPATHWLLTNMLLVGTVIGLSILLVLFAKSRIE